MNFLIGSQKFVLSASDDVVSTANSIKIVGMEQYILYYYNYIFLKTSTYNIILICGSSKKH
jgi:hypothetical protein